MAYQTKFDGSTDTTIQLGGKNKDGTPNPTSLEGYFLGSKDTDGDFGPGKLHLFQTKEGTIGVWGKSRLNGLLTKDIIGQMTLVTFTGMIAPTKKGRRPAYGYKVQHDTSNTIDVGDLNLNAASAGGADEGSEDEELASVGFASSDSYHQTAEPRVAAAVPNAARQAQVQALLNKNKKS